MPWGWSWSDPDCTGSCCGGGALVLRICGHQRRFPDPDGYMYDVVCIDPDAMTELWRVAIEDLDAGYPDSDLGVKPIPGAPLIHHDGYVLVPWWRAIATLTSRFGLLKLRVDTGELMGNYVSDVIGGVQRGQFYAVGDFAAPMRYSRFGNVLLPVAVNTIEDPVQEVLHEVDPATMTLVRKFLAPNDPSVHLIEIPCTSTAVDDVNGFVYVAFDIYDFSATVLVRKFSDVGDYLGVIPDGEGLGAPLSSTFGMQWIPDGHPQGRLHCGKDLHANGNSIFFPPPRPAVRVGHPEGGTGPALVDQTLGFDWTDQRLFHGFLPQRIELYPGVGVLSACQQALQEGPDPDPHEPGGGPPVFGTTYDLVYDQGNVFSQALNSTGLHWIARCDPSPKLPISVGSSVIAGVRHVIKRDQAMVTYDLSRDPVTGRTFVTVRPQPPISPVVDSPGADHSRTLDVIYEISPDDGSIVKRGFRVPSQNAPMFRIDARSCKKTPA